MTVSVGETRLTEDPNIEANGAQKEVLPGYGYETGAQEPSENKQPAESALNPDAILGVPGTAEASHMFKPKDIVESAPAALRGPADQSPGYGRDDQSAYFPGEITVKSIKPDKASHWHWLQNSLHNGIPIQ